MNSDKKTTNIQAQDQYTMDPIPTVRQSILREYMRVLGCRECGFITGRSSSLLRHLVKKHGAVQLKIGGGKWELLTEVIEERGERFACGGCPFKGTSKRSLVRHMGSQVPDEGAPAGYRGTGCGGVPLSGEEIESIEVATSTITNTIPRTGLHAYSEQELGEMRRFTVFGAPSLTSRWRVAMNEAVAKISAKAPSLEKFSESNNGSINGTIFDLAKEAVGNSGFAYVKGKSRARARKPDTEYNREFATFVIRTTTSTQTQPGKSSSMAGGHPVGGPEQQEEIDKGKPARQARTGPGNGGFPTNGHAQSEKPSVEAGGLPECPPTQQVHRDCPAGSTEQQARVDRKPALRACKKLVSGLMNASINHGPEYPPTQQVYRDCPAGSTEQQARVDGEPVLRARRKLVVKLQRISIDTGEPPLKEVNSAIKMSSKTEIYEECSENIKVIMKAQKRMLTSIGDQAMLDLQAVMWNMEDEVQKSNRVATEAINEALEPVIRMLRGGSPDESVEWLANPNDEDNHPNTTGPDSEGTNSSNITQPDTKGRLVYSRCTKGDLMYSPASFSGGGIVAEGLRVPRDIGMVDNHQHDIAAARKGKRWASRPEKSAGKKTRTSAAKKNPL